AAPSAPGCAALIARSMRSRGRFCLRPAWIAARRRGLCAGSGIPCLAATMISRASLLKILPFFASLTLFWCMTFFAWGWPAIRSRGLDWKLLFSSKRRRRRHPLYGLAAAPRRRTPFRRGAIVKARHQMPNLMREVIERQLVKGSAFRVLFEGLDLAVHIEPRN